MPVVIQIRHGSAAEAAAANEVLEVGQEGFEVDTGRRKIGDGVTAWLDLPYEPTTTDISDAVAAEAALREAADDTLQGNIDTEEAARIAADLLSELLANKNVAGGYAGLDGTGKIASAQLPALAITDTFPVGSEAAMLALAAEVGDVAVRSDVSKSFILRVAPATVLANWSELLSPTDAVTSVNGLVGVVNLLTTNIAEGSNLYFTTARVLATVLAGFAAGANATIVNTDTVLQAFAKAQGQINARFPLAGGDITGTLGSGYVGLIHQSAHAANPTANNIRLYAQFGRFTIKNDGGHIAGFSLSAGENYYQLPVNNGTIARLEDIPAAFVLPYQEIVIKVSQSDLDAPTVSMVYNGTSASYDTSAYLSTGKYKVTFDSHLTPEEWTIEPHNCISDDVTSGDSVSVHASISELDDHDLIIHSFMLKNGSLDHGNGLLNEAVIVLRRWAGF